MVTGAASGLILRCSSLPGPYMRRSNLVRIFEEDRPVLSLAADSTLNFILYGDVAGFIRHAVSEDLTGVFNAVSSSNLRVSEIVRGAGKEAGYGGFPYDCGNVSNEKIAGVFAPFRKTSLQAVREFALERYGLKPGSGK